MKVSDLLESRRVNWRELEQLCGTMEGASRRRAGGRAAARFAALYRAACADLALADAYQLPPGVVQYLHQLVARAHNQLYRSRRFRFATWARVMLVDVPRQLFHDNYLRLAFALFWGTFLLSMYMAQDNPDFTERIAGREAILEAEESFSQTVFDRQANEASMMAGYYILRNAGIGLRCFAFGLGFGILGLYALVFNAAMFGAIFGHMVNLPQRDNFIQFVTAHAPFELTAIILSAAAGMRMGFSLVRTEGFSRVASLRQAAIQSVPTMGAAVVMFFLAALIEGFISPSALPYEFKIMVAILSAGLLMFYFVMLGFPHDGPRGVFRRLEQDADPVGPGDVGDFRSHEDFGSPPGPPASPAQARPDRAAAAAGRP